ncbi:hypothetical protein EYF80_039387 [Liparis tanakae]|uniref:Uncharacterized protein n=1 Tax=Liparis tanakae TaxID=230148 RepID=A0A4Z2GB11_9TELE|nr:hypothetical protein EYF80_039387 [Liparis tanakae]
MNGDHFKPRPPRWKRHRLTGKRWKLRGEAKSTGRKTAVRVSEVKQQVSDWHCTDLCGGGVKEACWDLRFPPDPSPDTHVAS